MINYFKKNKGKIASGIAILTTLFGFYAYFVPYSGKPNLCFYFQQNYAVVSNYYNVDSLTISYKGDDIVKNGQRMIIERIKIVNKGREEVRLSDYGPDPFGLKVLNCRIIGVTIPQVEDGDEYLRSTLKPFISDSNHIYFEKTVFEVEKPVFVDVYILYKKGQDPDYYPIGKIVGQDIIDIFNKSEEPSGLADSLLNVFLVLILIIDIVGVPVLAYFAFIAIRSQVRKRIILKLFDYPLRELSEEQIVLVKMYRRMTRAQFVKLLKTLLNFTEQYPEIRKMSDSVELVNGWLRSRAFFWFKKVRWDTPYTRVHWLLDESKVMVRDKETKRPSHLTNSFIEEIRSTLHLLDEDIEENKNTTDIIADKKSVNELN